MRFKWVLKNYLFWSLYCSGRATPRGLSELTDDDDENENQKKRPFYESAMCACTRRPANYNSNRNDLNDIYRYFNIREYELLPVHKMASQHCQRLPNGT